MIDVKSVHKRYRAGGRWHVVFDDLSFTVPSHAHLGILGRNGAGKSTLMRLLAGIEAPDRGRIHVGGTVSWPVGLSGAMQGSLTGRQNARFVARVHGLSGDALEACVDGIQAFAEIGKHFDAPVKTYSSGMRARLNFAASVVFDFDVWLIDEITAVGDARFRSRCAAVMAHKRQRAQFVLVSHNPEDIASNCDCAIVLGPQPTYFADVDEALAHYRREVLS